MTPTSRNGAAILICSGGMPRYSSTCTIQWNTQKREHSRHLLHRTSTAQHNTTQLSSAQHSITQRNTARHAPRLLPLNRNLFRMENSKMDVTSIDLHPLSFCEYLAQVIFAHDVYSNFSRTGYGELLLIHPIPASPTSHETSVTRLFSPPPSPRPQR